MPNMGGRFPDCSKYSDCLWRAALSDSRFTCEGCVLYDPVERRMSPHELAGCYALLLVLFGTEEEQPIQRTAAREVGAA